MTSTTPVFGGQVTLSPEWIQLWTVQLSHDAFFTYLQLAALYEEVRELNDGDLSRLFGEENAIRLENGLTELAEMQLIEVINENSRRTLHFPHRNSRSVHEAEACLPSMHAALAFQKHMNEEALNLSTQDDASELREELFAKYPELKQEFEVYQQNQDEDSPKWRLWLELSQFLINQFEQRFGSLRATHTKTFKEASAQLLRHKLSTVDAITKEVFKERRKIFHEFGDNWIVSIDDQEFTSHPLIKQLSQRYEVGPAQIYVNTLELLAQSDFIVAEVNSQGQLSNLFLPTTTGLSKSEQRLLFLCPEDKTPGAAAKINQEPVKRAIHKYSRYLMTRGAELLEEFEQQGRLSNRKELIKIIAMRVNESLNLVPNCDDKHLVNARAVEEILKQLSSKTNDEEK